MWLFLNHVKRPWQPFGFGAFVTYCTGKFRKISAYFCIPSVLINEFKSPSIQLGVFIIQEEKKRVKRKLSKEYSYTQLIIENLEIYMILLPRMDSYYHFSHLVLSCIYTSSMTIFN